MPCRFTSVEMIAKHTSRSLFANSRKTVDGRIPENRNRRLGQEKKKSLLDVVQEPQATPRDQCSWGACK